MSASDEFPRGYSLNTNTGGTASVTIPGIAGISHVITAIDASAFYDGTTPPATAINVQVNSSSGTFTSFVVGYITFPADTTGGFPQDSVSYSGQLICAPGESVTISLSDGKTNLVETLTVQAYDI